jgi:membrane protein
MPEREKRLSSDKPNPQVDKLKLLLEEAWRVVRETLDLYTKHGCAIRAAGVAYHLLLSIFPLLLFLIFLSSQIFVAYDVRKPLSDYLNATFPGIASEVMRIVNETLQARGSFGWIGGLLLVWSASSVFFSVFETMNVIWGASNRSLLRRRAAAIASVIVICLLFIASVWLSALTVWPLPSGGSALRYWIQFIIDPGLIIIFLWLIFRILPNRTINPRAALAGAALSGILWRMARSAFAWFLNSDLANYGLLYGSVASVVILMLWAYFSGAILYLGATFGSVLESRYWSEK